MNAVAFFILLTLGLVTANDPFVGVPALWTVKMTPPNCTDGKPGTTPVVNWRPYAYTGYYGCMKDENYGMDFYAECNGTHIISKVFRTSNNTKYPCSGKVVNTTAFKLGECHHHDWFGRNTGTMYTYFCEGMWCNTTCDTPPCPLEAPCDVGTACCMNGNGPNPCGSVAMCPAGTGGETGGGGFFYTLIKFVRYGLIIAILSGVSMFAVNNGYCNFCPWRRGYGGLTEMA